MEIRGRSHRDIRGSNLKKQMILDTLHLELLELASRCWDYFGELDGRIGAFLALSLAKSLSTDWWLRGPRVRQRLNAAVRGTSKKVRTNLPLLLLWWFVVLVLIAALSRTRRAAWKAW